MKSSTKQGKRDADAAQWLAQLRQQGFEFRLLGIAGQPATMKIHMAYTQQRRDWIREVVYPQLVAHKPALVVILEEEGRQRMAAQIGVGTCQVVNQKEAA